MRRNGTGAMALLAFLALVVAGCSGPTQLTGSVNAAFVSKQAITMDRYLQASRVIGYLGLATNNTPLPLWQTVEGRVAIAQQQQGALATLTSDVLLDQYAATKDAKGNPLVNAAQEKQAEDAQLKQLFNGQLPPMISQLVNQGILTPETYRPFLHQSLMFKALLPNITTQVAHVKMLSVPTQAQANTLLGQLQDHPDQWADLARKNSKDPAASNGGDVTTLPQGAIAKLDAAIFGTKTVDPKAIVIVPTAYGYTLVQTISRNTSAKLSDLDTTVAVFPNSTVSVQGTAINGWMNTQLAKVGFTPNVNWCNTPSGNVSDCGPLFQTV